MLTIKKPRPDYRAPLILVGIFLISFTGSLGVMQAFDPKHETADRNTKLVTSKSKEDDSSRKQPVDTSDLKSEGPDTAAEEQPVQTVSANQPGQPASPATHQTSSNRPANTPSESSQQAEPADQSDSGHKKNTDKSLLYDVLSLSFLKHNE